MRLTAYFNGWRDAPHCWRAYLFSPVRITKVCAPGDYGYHDIKILGFVWFVRFDSVQYDHPDRYS